MSTARRLFTFALLSPLACASAGAWTFHPAAAAEFGYDDNVFLQDRAARLPAVLDPVPDEAASGFVRASASLTARAGGFTAAYTAELTRYEAFSSENHDDHRLDLSLKGRSGDWSHNLKAGLLLVSGDEYGPVYGHAGGSPAIGGAGVRARRDQAAIKASGSLVREFEGGFLRATAAVNYQDFQTRHLSAAIAPGYANYVDRAEYVAGIEGGRAVRKDFALVAAVRAGAQHQADLLGVPQNASNDLLRLLAGVEGRISSDLKVSFLAGPDIRRYGPDVAAGFDRDQTARYIEAAATWTPTKSDTLALTAKDYLWISSGGRTAYQHTNVNLSYDRALNADWSAGLSANVEVGDNRDYVPAASHRFDWIYTGTLTATRRLGDKTTLDFKLAREWSDSVVTATPGREYTRWLASAGVRHAF